LNGHIEEGLLERARIVVTELVTNSVRHARLSPAQRIAVRVWAQRELLRVEVIDDGNGFDPAATDVSHSTRVWCEFKPAAAPEPRGTG
jgi:anti-sigma regulatory factor (Ser/Thr protein kinase)